MTRSCSLPSRKRAPLSYPIRNKTALNTFTCIFPSSDWLLIIISFVLISRRECFGLDFMTIDRNASSGSSSVYVWQLTVQDVSWWQGFLFLLQNIHIKCCSVSHFIVGIQKTPEKVRIGKKVNFELIRRINKANIRFVTRVVQSKYRSPHEEWNPTTSDFALRSAHAHIIPSELLE